MDWREEYETGISAIDHEHHVLVDYVSDIEYAVAANDYQAVECTIGRLISFSITHFSFEETLMETQHYRDIHEHIDGHKRFLAALEVLQGTAQVEEVAKTLAESVQTLLVRHLTSDDKEYASSLTAKNRGWVQEYFPS